MGREFNFPIDFATEKTFSTNNDPEIIFEYTKDLVFSQINKDIQHNRFKKAGIDEQPADKKDNLRAAFQPNFETLASEIATTLPPIPSSEELNDSSQASNSVNDVNSNYDDAEEGTIPNSSQLQPRTFKQTTHESQQPQYDLSILIPKLISSQDKLFFISHAYLNHRRREWKLVQLDLKATMEFNPMALTDCKFLVKYLIAHPHDSDYIKYHNNDFGRIIMRKVERWMILALLSNSFDLRRNPM